MFMACLREQCRLWGVSHGPHTFARGAPLSGWVELTEARGGLANFLAFSGLA